MRGSIKKRSKSSWTIVVDLGPDLITGKRRQNKLSVKGTKKKAEERLAEILNEINEGTYVEPSNLSCAWLIAKWLSDDAERNCSPKTVERYRQLADSYILPRIGSVPLTRINTLVLECLYNDLRDGGGKNGRPLSAKTVRHVAGVMSAALTAAIRWKKIKISPAAAVKLPKVERREARVLTEVEIDWLLSAALSEVYWLRPLLAVSIATGCRRGELLALRWSDIHMDAAPPFLSITRSLEQTKEALRIKLPKNGKPRRCPLPGLAVESLRDHLAKQQEFRESFGDDYRADLDIVFATPEGDYLKPDSVTAKVCLLTKNCNMAGASLHTMRHSHGSQLLSAGVPLPTVSKRLGHSSVNVTASVYAHAFAADELAAADAWEQRFQKLRDQSVTNQATH